MPIPDHITEPSAPPAAPQGAPNPFRSTFGGVKRITASPRPPFLLRAHPRAFEQVDIDGTPTWVPQLSVHILTGGAAGIRTLARGEEDQPELAYAAAKRSEEEDGFVYLDPLAEITAEFRPDGVNATSYCYPLPCITRRRQTGTRWTELWDVPQETPPGMDAVFKYDRDKFNRWRAHLVQTGQVPAPSHLITNLEQQRAQRRLDRAQAMPAGPARDEKVKTAAAYVKAHNDAVVPTATDAPKPKRGRKGA